MKKTALILLALLVAGLLAWWLFLRGDADDRSPLAFVPADTPYVLAIAEPLPAEIIAQYQAQYGLMRDLYVQQLQDVRDLVAGNDSMPAEIDAVLEAVMAELQSADPDQPLASLGIEMTARSAIYGIGLLPVLRMEVADPARLEAFIGRIEARMAAPIPRGQVNGQAYWLLGPEDAPVRGVMALADGHLVLSLLPIEADEDVVRTVLGLAPPSRSLAASGELRELGQRLGLRPELVGYVHTQRMIDALTGPASAVDRAFLDLFEASKPALEGSCRDEYAQIAGAWPRIAVGYTRLDARHQDARVVVESRADIAQELMKLRAPMPGLSSAQDSLMSFGMAFRIANLPQVANALTANAARQPWTCPSLDGLNAAVAQAREQMTSPALFMAAPVFRGVHVALTRMDPDSLSFGADGNPFADGSPDFGAVVVVGTDNPASLLAMAQSALPAGARLPLQTDGVARPLPPLPGAPFEMPVHVAMNEQTIALSIGAGEQDLLADALRSDPAVQPLMSASVDARFYQLFADAMVGMLEQASADGTDTAAPAGGQDTERLIRDMKAMRDVYARLFKRVDMRLELTERGIELIAETEMP